MYLGKGKEKDTILSLLHRFVTYPTFSTSIVGEAVDHYLHYQTHSRTVVGTSPEKTAISSFRW